MEANYIVSEPLYMVEIDAMTNTQITFYCSDGFHMTTPNFLLISAKLTAQGNTFSGGIS